MHDLKPFHKSILQSIRIASKNDLMTFAELLETTLIPEGHDEIIATWEKRCREMCCDDFGVPDMLRRQKEALAGGTQPS